MGKPTTKPFVANDLLNGDDESNLTETLASRAVEAHQSQAVSADALQSLEEKYPDGIIKIIAVNGRVQGPVRITPFMSKHGRLLTGQEEISLEEKRRRYAIIVTEDTSYTIRHENILDMNSEEDRISWGWVKHFPLLAKRAEEVTDETLFFVENKKALVSKKISMRKLRDQAADVIRQAKSIDELLQICRLLGERPERFAKEELVEWLRDTAEAQPERILSKTVNNKNREYELRILWLKDMGHITVDKEGFWRYEQASLGTSLGRCTEYIKDRHNEELLIEFDRILKQAGKL